MPDHESSQVRGAQNARSDDGIENLVPRVVTDEPG